MERQSHRDGPPLLKEHHGSAGNHILFRGNQLGSLEETVLTLAEALLRPQAPQVPAPREASRDGSREGSRDGSSI
jgi:hypothetical protein